MGRAKWGKIKMLEKFQTTTYSLRGGKQEIGVQYLF